MTLDDAIKLVNTRANGRTRFDGQEPFMDELLLTEIERLRAIVDKLPKTADGVPITPGSKVWVTHEGMLLRFPVWKIDQQTEREYCIELFPRWFTPLECFSTFDALQSSNPD